MGIQLCQDYHLIVQDRGFELDRDIMDWDYETDETDSKMIFAGPMDSDDAMSLIGHKNMDVVSDVESAIGNLPMTKTYMTTGGDDEPTMESKDPE